MNIETKWLEDFLSLADSQSFSRSAEERHLTQPAFSRRIKALEAAVGAQLVDRTSVPVHLTDEGALFRMTARNLVAQLRECVSHLQSLRKKGTRVIDVAVSHTLSLSLFPALIQSLQHELEDTRTRQLVANVDDSVQALKNGICDFLLAFEDPTLASEQFRRLELQTETLVPVCRSDEEGRPLFDLDADGAQEVPYLSYPREIYLGRCVERLLARAPHPVTLRPTFESPLADSLKVMALQGMGVAWVPSFAIREELRQGFLTVCGGAAWQVPLQVSLYRCSRALSQDVEMLWQVLEHRYGAAVADVSGSL
ncbi:LysR substrate-binding domain-containing protein [Marinobacterium sedimentorum]|uniref:LysR substrate-binding domain-containing protein n=1 Tax=Marinobacterium sedimentorum TaxID=2927804 RepID=UPI0020C708F3|nr:LysR substrate-binding domain-containing protein [Marinobacterium sedimentorum]MCP8686625.1 LysR substrate-binding domain-containing protein [Marinobacterium sedimentorum]